MCKDIIKRSEGNYGVSGGRHRGLSDHDANLTLCEGEKDER